MRVVREDSDGKNRSSSCGTTQVRELSSFGSPKSLPVCEHQSYRNDVKVICFGVVVVFLQS